MRFIVNLHLLLRPWGEHWLNHLHLLLLLRNLLLRHLDSGRSHHNRLLLLDHRHCCIGVGNLLDLLLLGRRNLLLLNNHRCLLDERLLHHRLGLFDNRLDIGCKGISYWSDLLLLLRKWLLLLNRWLDRCLSQDLRLLLL